MTACSPESRITPAPAGPHRPRAFTLIELVVVIVLIGVMAAVAVPRFAAASTRYRVDAAVQQIIADLNVTAALANRASASRTISFEPDDETYTLVDQPSKADPDEDQVVHLGREPFGVNLLQVTFGADTEVAVSGHGLLLESGQLTVAAGRHARRLIFSQGSTTVTVTDLTLTEPTDDEDIDVEGTGGIKTVQVGGMAQAVGQ